jgi:hypothetical protein
MMWLTSSRATFFAARHARIAARYARCVGCFVRSGRFGPREPHLRQRSRSRRFTAARATDHQWFAQNASPHPSLHHDLRRGGSGAAHHPHAPVAARGASEQTARRPSRFVTGARGER